MNEVIHGDCLDILRTMPSESVDLIYMDPPFIKGGEVRFRTRSKLRTYPDYHFRDYNGLDDMIDNLDPVLVECRRVLKSTGSIYVHCNDHFDFAVRMLLNDIFGPDKFKNQIVWCYLGPGSSKTKNFIKKHDIIYFFIKDKDHTFNMDDVRVPYKHGAALNRSWMKEPMSKEEMQAQIDHMNSIGKLCEDWWQDVPTGNQISRNERNGYPTQKPLKLLDRIIKASSNEGDVVLDPFCGSGTTLVAAKKLGRKYIGIDRNIDAVELSRERLEC